MQQHKSLNKSYNILVDRKRCDNWPYKFQNRMYRLPHNYQYKNLNNYYCNQSFLLCKIEALKVRQQPSQQILKWANSFLPLL